MDEEDTNDRVVAAEGVNVLNWLGICRNMQFVGQEIVNKTDYINYQHTCGALGCQLQECNGDFPSPYLEQPIECCTSASALGCFLCAWGQSLAGSIKQSDMGKFSHQAVAVLSFLQCLDFVMVCVALICNNSVLLRCLRSQGAGETYPSCNVGSGSFTVLQVSLKHTSVEKYPPGYFKVTLKRMRFLKRPWEDTNWISHSKKQLIL